jgi:hypothetical protein
VRRLPTSLPLRALTRFAGGSYIDRAACDAAFERMHRRDRIGDRIHLALACLGLFLVSGPVTVTELAFAPLLVFFVVRVMNTGPLWIHGFGQPSVLAAVGLMAWGCVTLAWSADPMHGLDEIGRLRWLVLLGLVFPVIERRGALVTALALGLTVAGMAQLLSGIEPFRGLFPARHPGRVTGWWDPVVAGSVQCGAAGLFLYPALRGVGRVRWIGGVGLAVALAGVLASGTRGAWIAAALLLVIGVPLTLRGAGKPMKLGAMGVGVIGLVLLGVVGLTQREGLIIRVEQARTELAAAAGGNLDSPTGARVAVMGLALESGLRRPWGTGAGGFQDAVVERFGPEHAAAGLAHAHSAPLHLFGTLGWLGLVLGGVWAWTVLRNAAVVEEDPASVGGGLLRGLPLGIAGVLLAGLFDAVHLNVQTCALLGAMAALAPAYRPGSGRISTQYV